MIGILDSGVGGEIVAEKVRELFPSLDILLLKDTKNAPYGTKSEGELITITEKNIELILRHGAAKVLIGCCTASCVWDKLSSDARAVSIPIIEPTARLAKKTSKSGKIALIATESTVRGGAFSRVLGDSLSLSLPLQSLVKLTESGARDGALTRGEGRFLDELLAPLSRADADTLILGCTHFPSLENEILKRVKKYGIQNTVSSALAAALELGSYPESNTPERGLTVNI